MTYTTKNDIYDYKWHTRLQMAYTTTNEIKLKKGDFLVSFFGFDFGPDFGHFF
jgi:hypothetical protein